MSRQAEWQAKMRAEHRCQVCGNAETVAGYCEKHHKMRQARRHGKSVNKKTCSLCGKLGHNKRGCQETQAANVVKLVKADEVAARAKAAERPTE